MFANNILILILGLIPLEEINFPSNDVTFDVQYWFAARAGFWRFSNAPCKMKLCSALP
jgi:hypothetical protein